MPKMPPIYDGRFVLRPEQDTSYVHFEGAADHPFQPDPDVFPRVNVWWLAEAALFSYWDPDAALRGFNAAGLEAEFVKEGGTECYVVWQSNWLAVAFRGTEGDQWSDILTDAKFAQIPWLGGARARGLRPCRAGDRAETHTGDQPSGGWTDPLVLRTQSWRRVGHTSCGPLCRDARRLYLWIAAHRRPGVRGSLHGAVRRPFRSVRQQP